MYSSKAVSYLSFAAFVVYMIINLALIFQVFQNPEMTGSIPWLSMFITLGLSVFFWNQAAGFIPERGLLVLGLTIVVTGITYGLLVLLPDLGFVSRLLKVFLVVVCGLALLPLGYHTSIRHKAKQSEGESEFYSFGLTNSPASRLLFIWGGVSILIFSYFAAPVFLRSDILGNDTPTYIFRARLLDNYGISEHARIGGGFQIAFPMLSIALERLTGLDYIDVVRILPPIIMTLICLASGYFAYLLVGSQFFALSASLFTAAWGLSPHLIVDARDNITVMLFGILGMICLSKTKGKNSWLFELLQGLFLILAGLSHLSLSSIFFITTLHVNFMEFYDSYWLGDRKNILRHLWKAIRVPLISGLVVVAIWFPALLDFIVSLGFGLRTHTELGAGRDPSFSWIIKRYNLTINIPWILLGYTALIWSTFSGKHAKSYHVLYAWSTLCLIFGIVLHPISFLNSRFLSMTPIFLLIPIAFRFIASKGIFKHQSVQSLIQFPLALGFIGILLNSNLLLNAKLLVEIPGLATKDYQNLMYVTEYVEANHSQRPFVFLVEDTSPHSEALSDLWQRIIRARIADEGLTSSYIYFGTLDHLLSGEQTPLHTSGLPRIINEDAFTNSSQRWFEILEENGILETPEMTIFIIETFNPDVFSDYEYLPGVDTIGPGILVVYVSKDLMAEEALIWGIH